MGKLSSSERKELGKILDWESEPRAGLFPFARGAQPLLKETGVIRASSKDQEQGHATAPSSLYTGAGARKGSRQSLGTEPSHSRHTLSAPTTGRPCVQDSWAEGEHGRPQSLNMACLSLLTGDG